MPLGAFRLNTLAQYMAPSGYTVPTSAFTTDANTKALYKFDENFGDFTNRTPLTVTRGGNGQISTAQSKFGSSSYLGDGTGDYLSVSPVTSLATSTNNFTIEFFVRFSNTTTAILYDTRPASTQGNYPVLYWTGSTIRFYLNGADRITSTTFATLTWHHVALVRTGNDYKLYVNGTQRGSTYTNSASLLASQCVIGADAFSIGTSSLNGYIDELRVSNTARYTTTFTPTTTAFAYDSNTLLLLHMDGTNASTIFTDDAGRAMLTYDTPTINTTTKKFGAGSLPAPGSTTFPSVYTGTTLSDFVFANKDFTCECWIYLNAYTNLAFGYAGGVPKTITLSDGTNNAVQWGFGCNTNGKVRLFYWNGSSASSLEGTTALSTGSWHHIAFDHRSSDGRIRLLVDGAIEATATRVGTNTATSPQFRIGGFYASDTTSHWSGFVDEVRVSHTLRY